MLDLDGFRGMPTMNKTPTLGSRATALSLSILAVPVLYLLSVPPVCELSVKHAVKHSVNMPAWVQTYMGPWHWVRDNTPLKPAMMGYARWWKRMIHGDIDPFATPPRASESPVYANTPA
jgi:hypothetical protein